MNHTPGPWKLCSNELERNFQIVGADGIPIAALCTQNSALVEPWRNKKTPPQKLWQQIAMEREQANARLLKAAPEMFECLIGQAHRFLRKNGYDMTQIDALLNRIAGEK